MKILICDRAEHMGSGRGHLDFFAQHLPDAQVEVYAYHDDVEELIAHLQGVQGVITAFVPFTQEVLSRAAQLRCISVTATGYGNIDVEAARRLGIAVCHVREYCTQEVADHTLMLMLSLARQVKPYIHAADEEKRWGKRVAGSLWKMQGRTLAIYGFGRIGQAVAKRAKAFGMRVLVVSPRTPAAVLEQHGCQAASDEQVWQQADVISNHMPHTPQTEGYFCASRFGQAKKRPIFINTGRGACVDEAALVSALDQGVIGAAGLDVLSSEAPDLTRSPLVGRDNVIITPHVAFRSEESLRMLMDISRKNLLYYFTGEHERIFSVVAQTPLKQ